MKKLKLLFFFIILIIILEIFFIIFLEKKFEKKAQKKTLCSSNYISPEKPYDVEQMGKIFIATLKKMDQINNENLFLVRESEGKIGFIGISNKNKDYAIVNIVNDNNIRITSIRVRINGEDEKYRLYKINKNNETVKGTFKDLKIGIRIKTRVTYDIKNKYDVNNIESYYFE